MTSRHLLILIIPLAIYGLPSPATAGIGPVVTCCMVTCEGEWTACGSFFDCPSGACASTPTQNMAAGTCGEGDFASCPADESGQCADGVNNDEYKNDLTDCDDPACATDPACAPPTATPTAPPTATPTFLPHGGNGCHIATTRSGLSAILLLAPLAALLRRRRAQRVRV